MLETTKERTTKGVDHEPGSRTDLQPPTLAGAPVLRTRTRRRRRTRKMIRIRRRRQGMQTNETIPQSWILRKRSSNTVAQGHRRPRITTSARRLHGYDIMVSAAVVKKTTITLTITISAILTASVISPGARDSVARSDATFGHCQTCTVQNHETHDGWRATMAMGSVAKQVRSRIMIIMEQMHET